jgi:hypothetical protein
MPDGVTVHTGHETGARYALCTCGWNRHGDNHESIDRAAAEHVCPRQVMFRKDVGDGSIIAVFPGVIARRARSAPRSRRTTYRAYWGSADQPGEIPAHWCGKPYGLAPASPGECAALLAELTAHGHVLRVTETPVWETGVDRDGMREPWPFVLDGMAVHNVHAFRGRTHKLDGERGDGAEYTVCGRAVDDSYRATDMNKVTCAGCERGLKAMRATA